MAKVRHKGSSAGHRREPRDPTPPPGLEEDDAKLNSHVWKLYAPQGMHNMEIIFFHGLQLGDSHFEDAFWKAWVSVKDDNIVWPKDWLSKTFENARILSVSYNASTKLENAGAIDTYLLGENLVSDIILDSEFDIGQRVPVFLVGHCLGGIVIKQFILSAIKKQSMMNGEQERLKITKVTTFLENFKGAFFYDTPHSGSDEIPKFIASQLQSANRLPDNPILRLLETLNTETARINDEFRQSREKFTARTFGMPATKHTIAPGYEGVLVPEGSTRNDVDGFYTHQTADHFSVCKATDKKDAPIKMLIQFIVYTLPEQTLHVQNATDMEVC